MSIACRALEVELPCDDFVIVDVLHDHHVHPLRSAILRIAVADTVDAEDLGQNSRKLPITSAESSLRWDAQAYLLIESFRHVLEVSRRPVEQSLHLRFVNLLDDEAVVFCLQKRGSRLAAHGVPFDAPS